jgi:hypothetical protein
MTMPSGRNPARGWLRVDAQLLGTFIHKLVLGNLCKFYRASFSP